MKKETKLSEETEKILDAIISEFCNTELMCEVQGIFPYVSIKKTLITLIKKGALIIGYSEQDDTIHLLRWDFVEQKYVPINLGTYFERAD